MEIFPKLSHVDWIVSDDVDESHISSCSDMLGHITSGAGLCNVNAFLVGPSAGRKSYRLVGRLLLKDEWFDGETFSLVRFSNRSISICLIIIQITNGFHRGSVVPGEYPCRQRLWIWDSKAWKRIRHFFVIGFGCEKNVSPLLPRIPFSPRQKKHALASVYTFLVG